MLAVTRRQLDTIAMVALLDAVERHWREVSPVRFASVASGERRQFARDCVDAARLQGLSRRDEIILYCDLCWVALPPAWPGFHRTSA